MPDVTDAVVVRWRGVDGVARRMVFEPDSAGEHIRIEYALTGGNWRIQGREPIEELAIECPAATSEAGP